MKIQDYIVAGHRFRVVLPEESPMWKEMEQYRPFEAQAEGEPVFVLEVVDKLGLNSPQPYFDQPAEPGETKIRIFRDGGDWYMESSVVEQAPVSMKLLVNNDFTYSRLEIARPSQALFALNNALMLQYAFRTVSLGTLEMHASVVVNGGKGYLWLAKSGTGKSTHSRMWLENIPGTLLLNDDNPIVRVLEDGSVRVYGSPWSGKTPCYVNADYPVGAFGHIVRAGYNKVTPLGKLDAYALVYSSSSGIKFYRPMADAMHGTLEKIVGSIPCYTVECKAEPEAAVVCRKSIG